MRSPSHQKGTAMIACGLDFGTSNSAIGVALDRTAKRGGSPARLAPIEAGSTLMPSAVFFDYETKGRVLFGNEAIQAYVGQTEGRLMRALKSLLGSPLIDEETSLAGRKVPLREVIEIFVRHLKQKAEAFAGHEITSVVHGRPVRFVDDDDKADARAQEQLEAIARRAGFRDVAEAGAPRDGFELLLRAGIGLVVVVDEAHRAAVHDGGDLVARKGLGLLLEVAHEDLD